MSETSKAASVAPRRLTIEAEGGHVWTVCSCGWCHDHGEAPAWGHVGWIVSQHANTHRARPNGDNAGGAS